MLNRTWKIVLSAIIVAFVIFRGFSNLFVDGIILIAAILLLLSEAAHTHKTVSAPSKGKARRR